MDEPRGGAQHPRRLDLALCALPGTAAVNLGLHVVLYRWSRRRRGLPAPL